VGLCSDTQRALLDVGHLTHLPGHMSEHVDLCEACQGFASRRQHLEELTTVARRALKQEMALTPSAWARVRTRIAEVDTAKPLWWDILRWIPVAAIPVALIVLGWTLSFGHGDAQKPEAFSVVTTNPKLHGESPNAFRVTSGEVAKLEMRTGGLLIAGNRPVAGELFGQHKLNLPPQSKVVFRSLRPGRIALELKAGAVTSEVAKRGPGESFEVWAAGHRVEVVGTVFTVALAVQGGVRVTVTRGQVKVWDRKGHAIAVASGQSWPASNDKDLAPVVDSASVTEPPADKGPLAVPAKRVVVNDAKNQRLSKRRKKKSPGRKMGAKTLPASNPKPLIGTAIAKGSKKSQVHVIERQIPDARMKPPAADTTEKKATLRERLVGVIKTIRAGRCGAALNQMSRLSRDLKLRRHPTDLIYLMGYCLRKLGKTPRADAFFAAYRKLTRSRRWVLPKSAAHKLPRPTVRQLR
jgi:hypothetical protein